MEASNTTKQKQQSKVDLVAIVGGTATGAAVGYASMNALDRHFKQGYIEVANKLKVITQEDIYKEFKNAADKTDSRFTDVQQRFSDVKELIKNTPKGLDKKRKFLVGAAVFAVVGFAVGMTIHSIRDHMKQDEALPNTAIDAATAQRNQERVAENLSAKEANL
jgi:hypothetical protein